MTAPDLPPHLHGLEEPVVDEEAEAVVSAIARLWGAQPWRITDERTAEWVGSKLAGAAREVDEAEVLAAEYRARIDAWLEDRTRRARATSAWASAHLERWGRERHAADPKVLSFSLPSAKVSSRKGALDLVVVDEQAAIRTLADEGLDDLVVSKLAGVAALKAALTLDETTGRAVTPDGTVVDGLAVNRKERTWTVKPAT